MPQVSIAEARNHLPRLVQQAEAGETVQITRRGRPVAVILSQEEYGRLRGERTGFMQFLDAWRIDAAKEDAGFAQQGDFENLRDDAPGREVDWD
jgi:prevent-host-death family protein